MYYKEMLSDEILKEIKQIMGYKSLTDFEKCLMIKNFCNNIAGSDAIHFYAYFKGKVAK